MRKAGKRALVLLLFTLGSLVRGPDARADSTPELVIESAPGFERFEARLRALDRSRFVTAMALTGLSDSGPPIRVTLAPEDSAAARAVPPWVVGYARGWDGTVVLFPLRTPTYPDGSFESVVQHEVAHVLISRAARGQPVPRWFNEGLAMMASRNWEIEDRARLTLALLPGRELRIGDLDAQFDASWGSAARAYAVSGAFVAYLLELGGKTLPATILLRQANGEPFEAAFARASGMSLEAAEKSFWEHERVWGRWIPLIAGSFTLWMGISLLALLAVRQRRRRDAAIKRAWEIEETWVDEEPDDQLVN